jgi:hypothetical protein
MVRREARSIKQRPWVVSPGGAASSAYQTLSVLGGNAALIGGGIEGIQYASTVTPAAVYDPDVTTVYPAGLGYGVLFNNGVRQAGNVLIRHDYYGNQWAVLQSALLRVAGTVSLSYDPGTGPVTMTCYTFDWI